MEKWEKCECGLKTSEFITTVHNLKHATKLFKETPTQEFVIDMVEGVNNLEPSLIEVETSCGITRTDTTKNYVNNLYQLISEIDALCNSLESVKKLSVPEIQEEQETQLKTKVDNFLTTINSLQTQIDKEFNLCIKQAGKEVLEELVTEGEEEEK